MVPFSWDRDLTVKLINLLRDNECLWNIHNIEYKNKQKRHQVLSQIAQQLATKEKKLNVRMVRDKIQALRSQYRRELRLKSSSEKPKLWFFELLDFLSPLMIDINESKPQSINGDTSKSQNISRRDFLIEFIECYKNHPALWDKTRKDYNKMRHIENGYKDLLVILRKHKKDAQIKDVQKKVRQLRCNYRKVYNKIAGEEELGSGSTARQCLWWFNRMSFLEKNIAMETLMDENTTSLQSSEEQSGDELIEVEYEQLFEENAASIEEKFQDDMKEILEYEETLSEKSLSVCCNDSRSVSQKENTIVDVDAFDLMARTWALKMRKLSQKQGLFAEKAINDILFEAEMGTLNRNSVKINESHISVYTHYD